MKLPVSFAAFDAVVAQLKDANALVVRMSENFRAATEQNEGHVIRILENHAGEVARCEKRYADLMASYRMLKLQGAVESAPTPKPDIKPVDPVEQAIRTATAGMDAEVNAAVRAKVAEARKTEMSDDEIIANIKRGSRPAEEMAS